MEVEGKVTEVEGEFDQKSKATMDMHLWAQTTLNCISPTPHKIKSITSCTISV